MILGFGDMQRFFVINSLIDSLCFRIFGAKRVLFYSSGAESLFCEFLYNVTLPTVLKSPMNHESVSAV